MLLKVGKLKSQTATQKGSRLLDLLTGTQPTAAYSLRKLRSAYSGSAINVRRSSDNAAQDIGFTAGGDLDTTALLAFTGAGSGFITTWYDQSGNGANALMATAAGQPRIVNSGAVETMNSKPVVRFLPSKLVVSGFTGFSNTNLGTISAISSIDGQAGTFARIAAAYKSGDANDFSGTSLQLLAYGSNNYSIGSWGATSLPGVVGGVLNNFFTKLNTGTGAVSIAVNTLSATATRAGTNLSSCDNLAIGCSSASNVFTSSLTGTIAELIYWPTDISSQQASLYSDQKTYYGLNDTPRVADGFGGTTASFGLRLLKTGYAGKAIRVRRDSDNTEQDIGFTAAGDLDTTALLAFTGTGGSNNGYVSKWYDQTGHSKDISQATLAAQPQIVSAGAVLTKNSKPSMSFNGSSQYLQALSNFGMYANGSAQMSCVASAATGQLGKTLVSEGNTASANGFYRMFGTDGASGSNGSFAIVNDAGTVVVSTTLTDTNAAWNNTLNVNSMTDSGTQANGYINNGTPTAQNYTRTNPTTVNCVTIGAANRLGASGFWAGSLSELHLWSFTSTNDRRVAEINEKFYFATP